MADQSTNMAKLATAKEEFNKLLNRRREEMGVQKQNVNYTNIVCLTCTKWVCSRNRIQHMESHLQYKPYKCSQCAYGARREIFVKCHMKEAHPEESLNVICNLDQQIEQRAKDMAGMSLKFTNFIKEYLGTTGDAAIESMTKNTSNEGPNVKRKRVLQESSAVNMGTKRIMNAETKPQPLTKKESDNNAAEEIFTMIKQETQTVIINVGSSMN